MVLDYTSDCYIWYRNEIEILRRERGGKYFKCRRFSRWFI